MLSLPDYLRYCRRCGFVGLKSSGQFEPHSKRNPATGEPYIKNLCHRCHNRTKVTPPFGARARYKFTRNYAPPGYRTCAECNGVFPLTREYFIKGNRSGCGAYCTVCHARRFRIARRKEKYGLPHQEFLQMWFRQHTRCAICHQHLVDDSRGNTHVDHCHQTGRIRGLLCHLCNTGLGMFRDDTGNLYRAIEYLNE